MHTILIHKQTHAHINIHTHAYTYTYNTETMPEMDDPPAYQAHDKQVEPEPTGDAFDDGGDTTTHTDTTTTTTHTETPKKHTQDNTTTTADKSEGTQGDMPGVTETHTQTEKQPEVCADVIETVRDLGIFSDLPPMSA